MAIAITAVAIICIGSVSAADETVDTNLTVDDNSQAISELNGGDDIDDVAMKDGNVDVEKKDMLSSSDEDVLKSDVTGYGYIWNHEKDGRPSAASYNTPTTSDQTYNDYITGQTVSIDLWMKSLSGTWYLNVNNEDKTNYYASNNYGWDDSVFNYQFTESGTYTIYAYYKGSSDNYVTNKLIFNVKEATKQTTTSLSLDKTTIAPGDSVKITPSVNVKGTTDAVTSGEFEIYVNDVLVSTINIGESYDYANTAEAIYYAYAKYIASTGYENSTSESKTFVINSDTSVVATTTAINLDKSIIEPGADVIITPTVTTPDGDVTGTVDLYDGEDNLIQANAVIGTPFTYTVSNVAGDYQIYARYLGNDSLKYMPSNSTKTTYKVKGQLKINLTVDGKTDFKAIGAYSSYSSNIINYVFYANCSGYAPLLKVYDIYNGETNLVYDGNVHGDSQEITMWFSYQNERGAHIVYAEFEGDDEYLPSRSNNVTFNVYEQKSYSNSMSSYSKLNFNPTTVMEGDCIAITPSIQYYSSGYKDAVGTVTIYDDSQRTVELGTVNVGEAFTYRVPFSDSTSQYTYYVYATYNGGYDDVSYTAFESGNLQGSFTVTIPKQTTLVLENLSDINIDFGNTVTVKPTLVDSDNNEVTAGTISWYVDGEWVANRTTTESYTTSSDLTAGTHTISAKYIGGNGYKESDSANNISIIINEEIKTLKIEIAAVEYPNEVMATVTASETGTYTITIGSKTIPVEITESDNGQKTVSLGKFNAGDDYEATVTSYSDAALTNSTTFTVNKGTLTLNIATAGNNTLKGEGIKTITATSTASDADGVVQYFEGTTQIGENSTLGAAFDVSSLSVGTHTITVKYIGNNYNCEDQTVIFTVKGDLTITLTRNGEGLVKPGDTVYFTITYSQSVADNLELWYNGAKLGDESGSASTSITFDETDIGVNNVSVRFLGDDNYDACESNVVKVKVVEPVATTVSLTLNTTEVRINGKILVTAHVYDSQGNEITQGDVKVYKTSNFYYADPIATVAAGESFELTVDSNTFSTYQNPYRLYSQYAGQTTDDNIYAASSNTTGSLYYHVSANNIELTSSEYNIYVGQSINLTVDVDGNGVITLFVDGVENSTIAKGTTALTLSEAKDYEFQATYTMTTSDYYASCVSEKVTVHVLETSTPVVEISLDKTSVSKDGTITVTPAVTGGSEGKGIVEFYDENDEKLGDIDLNQVTSFTFEVTGEAGTAHSVYAKYTDSNTAFPQASSEKKEYRIKGVLTIVLERNGGGLVKPGDTVQFTIKFSDEVSDNLELWVNDTKLGNEYGSSSTSVNFNSSDIGSNNVFIKFLGNDDYESCVSNNVTVEVIKPLTTTVTIELSSSEVIPGKNITIAPKVLDENGNEVTIGVVRIYDNMYANNDPIATINAGETANFTDLVNYAGTVSYLYAKYAGADSEDASYEASPVSEGVSYTVVSDNRIELTASEYNIYAGQSVDITAAVNGNGVITLKINGDDNGTLTKDEAKSFTLNEVGEYTFVAAYTRGTDYYISAVSEPITVHVTEKPVQNEITVSVENVVLPGNATVIVTALVDGIYTIDVNQTPVTVNVVGGKGNNTIKLSAGEYYANVTGHEDAKITNAVFKVSPEPKVGELIIRDATYPQNATIEISGDGNVTIYVEYYLVKPLDGATTERITFNVGGNNKVIENLINGSYTGAFSFVVNQTGEFTVNASYYGWKLMEGEYSFASENILTYSVTIKELPTDDKKNISLTVLVDEDEDDYVEADWTETFEIETYASDDISGVIIYREGETELGRANIGEVFELNASTLGLGEHNITAIFEGNDRYNPANRTFTIDVAKKIIWYTLQIDDVTFPDHAVGKFYGESVDGKYTITINGTDYTVEFEWYDVDGTVSFNITKLPAGTYKVSSVKYEDMEHYEIGETTIEGLNTLPTFEVKAGEVTLDDNVLTVSNGSAPTFSIDLENATGSLSVKVGNNTYTTELINGKATVEITDLPSGNHEATVTFNSTNGNYRSSSIQTSFNVKAKEVPDENTTINVDIPSDSLNPVFTFNLPGATGNLTVTIGDKKYTRELVNGTATIAVDELLPGSYSATVTYSGDKNHASISKNTTFTVPTPKLTGKNVAAIYSAAASYKVLATVNGKALADEKVTVKFNGKTYSLITDKNGYATLKLNTKVKVKKYTINVEFKGVKTSNTLTVKHLIKAKNIKAKKSKRVLNIKVSTNKVNGKFLKGKKLTLKVKGKTLKAKINKKGVATFKVKKSILNKLKVGKKYKYRVSYGKDAVTKKITVRR